MLPGFRFLFAAIVLSMSMLIFGLGAAALLRAAHEEFASIPSRRPPPETVFAQPSGPATPTLAMLRVEPPAMESKAPDNVPAAAPVEQPATLSTPAEPETPAVAPDTIATLDLAAPTENSPPTEMPKPEVSAPAIPAQADAPPQAEAPSPVVETKVAAIAEVPSPEQVAAPLDDSTRVAQTKIATLGGPPVAIAPETPPKKAAAAPQRSSIKKRAQARRAKERRKTATRARVVQQAPADPFALPFGR